MAAPLTTAQILVRIDAERASLAKLRADIVGTVAPVVTVPGAPTNVRAVAGNGQVTVSWQAPTNTGGSPITGFTVTKK